MKLRTLALFLGIPAAFASAASAEVRVIVKDGRRLIYNDGPANIAASEQWLAARMLRASSWDGLIDAAAREHAVDPKLVKSVMLIESGFNPAAVSRKGARGLMQLMPETAAILGVRDSFNPRENIHAGTRHLRGMMERFRYDLPMAIAAYNAGEKPVATFRGIPPYPETRDYVARVLRLYGAPLTWELQGSGIQQLVGRDGNVTYTNVAPRRFTTAALQGR